MSRMNKKHLIFFLIVFFIFAYKVSADLEIVEVMYDPEGSDTNREWVKIYNNGNDQINIIGGKTKDSWRFSEENNNKESKHYINDSIMLSPGGYGILASDKETFLSEYASFSGVVADTSMNLNNTLGTVRIYNELGEVVAYYDYNSDNDIDSEGDEEENNGEDNDSSSQNSNTSSSSLKKEVLPPLKITTKINIPKVIVAGDPFVFDSLTTTNRKETYKVGRFLWNFGDGMMTWTKESGPFEYVYEYPGEYVMTLSYFDNSFSEIPEAIDKVVVKVIDSGIFISGVGDFSDPYIELNNKSNYEIDLSGWNIIAGSKKFTFPDSMNILAGKKIKLSPKITGFGGSDISNIYISNPSGEIVTTYPLMKVSVSRVSNLKGAVPSSTSTSVKDLSDETHLGNSNVINLDDLGASAGDKSFKIPSSFYPVAGMFLVIGIGIASFLSVKKRNKNEDEIESQISADDIKIIE